MDVRPGDDTQTITQALLHNLSSVQRDAEMIVPILRSRLAKAPESDALNVAETLDHVMHALDLLTQTERDLKGAFSHAVGDQRHDDARRIYHQEIGAR